MENGGTPHLGELPPHPQIQDGSTSRIKLYGIHRAGARDTHPSWSVNKISYALQRSLCPSVHGNGCLPGCRWCMWPIEPK